MKISAFIVVLSLLCLCTPGRGQNAPQAPVFRTETRQVLVDVVITGHDGRFVPGLKSSDFTVLEDGKPQKVAAFTVHAKPAATTRPAPPIKLPANQYTNFQVADPERPITIVLLDVLNTHVQDQAYTRKQMIEFLKSLPAGERVALFALGTRLRMIQGFTGDSETLVAAAKMLLRETSPIMTSEQSRQADETLASNLQATAGPGVVGPSGGTPGGSGSISVNTAMIAPVASGIQNALNAEQTYQEMQRMDLTLAALASLAHSVSAYPGRKNLLWLAAEFPIRFGPDFVASNRASEQARSGGIDRAERTPSVRVNAPSTRETAAMLTASQIAVYPIDIRGTISTGTGIDIGTQDAYGSVSRISDARENAATRQTTMEWDAHESMTDIARETGGKAFYGSNDIKAALASSMDEGENYYTIAYRPDNRNWNGKYRKIEIKCAQGGVKLTHRRGYYALGEPVPIDEHGKTAEDLVAVLFATSMHPEAPTSTLILMKAQVLPPDAAHKNVRIDYAINARDVVFTDAPENKKHVMLDLMAVAWKADGKAAAEDSSKIDTAISPDIYQNVMQTYIPVHEELEVKPGAYTLRLGVVDRNSRKIGTMDVPLTIPEK